MDDPQEVRLHGITILVVDDDEDSRDLMRQVLAWCPDRARRERLLDRQTG